MLTTFVRRVVAQLCMLLLAHATWLAAEAPCATADTHTNAAHAVAHGAAHRAAHDGTVDGAHEQVHAPAESRTQQTQHVHGADDAAPIVPSSPASPAPAACSMAMACAMSALQITLPEVPVRVVLCDDDAPHVVATALRSIRTAPEPPPPRG